MKISLPRTGKNIYLDRSRHEVIIKDTSNWAREDVETVEDRAGIDLGNVVHNSRIVIAGMLIVNQHKGDVTLKTKGPIVSEVTVHVYIITAL